MNTKKIGSNYNQVVTGNKKNPVNIGGILENDIRRKKSMKDFY